MKTNLTFLTKVTAGGLVAVAIALWTQWLSGDPAYPKFPPGPVLFIGVAAIVIFGARWWWTPLIGALVALLTTSGWFARLPGEMLRLGHPGEVGKFAAGIFIGTVLQIGALLLTDIAGLAATVQNFRRGGSSADSAKMACRFFGGLFVVMGVLVIVGGAHVDKYHNLMHLAWGAIAFGFSFLGATAVKRFCIASGAFYLTLSALGMAMGNPALNRAWYFGPMLLHTGDHIFHLVLGSLFLVMGLVSGRQWVHRPSHAKTA
ncbi:MAG: hypothetical protein QOJ51_3237 [Acidobacteriaceae bacterium]|nr:hypothetical protein [Acidobacteriaceae bacterium]